MTFKVKVGLDAQVHDEFVAGQALCHLLQSSKWPEIKSSWTSEIIGFYRDDVLVASVSIMRRPLPLGFSMLYIPRGIAMDYTDKDLLQFVFSELRRYGKSQKALFIKFDPAVQFEDSEDLMKTLAQAGAKYFGRTTSMHDTIQPRFNAMIYRDEFSEGELDKKTKQKLKKARNSHPEVVFGSVELVPEFAELMKKTEVRKGVGLRDADYYAKLLTTYQDDAFLTLIRLDLGKLLAEAESDLQKNQERMTSTQNEKRQKTLAQEISRLTKTQAELTALVSQYGEKVPVAGGLIVNFANHAEHLYAGFDERFSKYYPAYLMWFESMKHAFDKGALTLDMGGLENSLAETDGLVKFKKHFNPHIEEYVGEFDLPAVKILYPLAKKAYKLRKSAF